MSVNSIVDLSFSDAINCCKDHSIVKWKDQEIIIVGTLADTPTRSWFNGSPFAMLRQKNANGQWFDLFTMCHFDKLDEFNKIEEIKIGTEVSIRGTLDFAGDCYWSSGFHLRLINCRVNNPKEHDD